ncbi:MAG: class I SAM-dependent methyltransferase [candidate division WOR-3 bacterium]|nr:class I SAM-dependent methyltransferase [candidate division WOR-3 bacterium]
MGKNVIEDIRRNWEEFARIDPLWSILPLPEKKGNRWKIDELYKTGTDEINSAIEYLKSLNINLEFNRALDFGCGAGRLTQALSRYFNLCAGVDISFGMLRLAQEYNQFRDKCIYILNCAPDLSIFRDNTFDFIYSSIVFQHLPPELTLNYIREFLRIIKERGVIIFQITTGIIGFSNKLRRYASILMPKPLRHLYKQLRYKTWGIKEMYWIREEFLNNFIISSGGKIIDCIDDFSSMPRYRGKRYCITK